MTTVSTSTWNWPLLPWPNVPRCCAARRPCCLAAFDAEQDDPQTRERSRAARRAFTLGPQDADGMSRGRFCLDPETRAYLEAFLAAKARPGMCNAADPLPAVDGDPEPMPAATDTDTTAQALRMAAHAHHYLYIYDEKCGRPIFLGRSQRLASADQRIVLHAIDGGCTMPGCDQSAYHCQVHHLIEWSPDGTTDIDRLALVCEQNHDLAGRTEAEWHARRRYDEISLGQTLWYPPKSVDPSRQPRANRYHRRPQPPRAKPDAA
jgi:hypothetical protein